MQRKLSMLLNITFLIAFVSGAFSQDKPLPAESLNYALINGKWFNGKTFDSRFVYSVKGRFSFKKPRRVDSTIDLTGTWCVPPFAEAHNHNIGYGVEARERDAIRKYIADGVFYVKIQGNLPISDERKNSLAINRPDSIDIIFAQGSFTGTGGHPIRLLETVLLPQGSYPGYTKETLKDFYYLIVDSEADLQKKWPLSLSRRPNFIKTILFFSDEFEKRKNDPAFFGRKGLDPFLLPKIVEKAHASNLTVSTHVTNAADFHHAVAAGVDEIVHLPYSGLTQIAEEDAKLAANNRIVVIATSSIVSRLTPAADLTEIRRIQVANLNLLRRAGVTLALGSDDVTDSSVKEVEYLQGLGVFDNLELLRMWSDTTPKIIFPKRKIGAIKEGYEASFLALEGNPLENLQNARKIKVRFKEGLVLGK